MNGKPMKRMTGLDFDRIAKDLLADMDQRITMQNPSDAATAQVTIVGIMSAQLVHFARACDEAMGSAPHTEQQYKDGLKKHIDSA